jgi:hypothetical protein
VAPDSDAARSSTDPTANRLAIDALITMASDAERPGSSRTAWAAVSWPDSRTTAPIQTDRTKKPAAASHPSRIAEDQASQIPLTEPTITDVTTMAATRTREEVDSRRIGCAGRDTLAVKQRSGRRIARRVAILRGHF